MRNQYYDAKNWLKEQINILSLDPDFTMETVVLVNQGKDFTSRQAERDLLDTWIKEKEEEGYEKVGIIIQTEENRFVQLMKKAKS